MPITEQLIVDGPHIQSDDSRRGTIEFTFDDGRKQRRTVRAPNAEAWANLLIELPSEVEDKQQQDDAEEASDKDEDIDEVEQKQANREQIALAFLRKAYSINNPYFAYIKFSRFNDYRVRKGWSLTQVVDGLSSVGLTQDEWDLMLARYQYLSNSARVTAMEAYQGVLAGDIWADGE